MKDLFTFLHNLSYIFADIEKQGSVIEFSLIIALASIAFYIFFYQARKIKNKWIKRFLHITSPKSPGETYQLGGFPFITLLAIGLIYILKNMDFLTTDEYSLFRFGILGFIGTSLYGYVDDRHEIAPASKLVFQSLIILNFSFLSSYILYPHSISMATPFIFILSVTIINGTNVLDGLDTLSFKLAMGSYLGYFLLSAYAQSSSAMAVSLLCGSALTGFYFYNKEPAKIYLGEIGSISIGFTYVFLACLTFNSISTKMHALSALSLVLLPAVLPIAELFISFSRRIINQKAPLKGDRYHLHFLLKDHYHFSASTTASLYGIFNVSIIIVSFTLSYFLYPIIALPLTFIGITVLSCLLARKNWFAKLRSLPTSVVIDNFSTSTQPSMPAKVLKLASRKKRDFKQAS